MKIDEVSKFKSETRNKIDIALLAMCFTAFTFLAANNPKILSENIFLSFQLVFAIPLFINNLFSRIKQAYKDPNQKWDTLGFLSFTLAMGFFINFIGLLLTNFISIKIVMLFFFMNIFLALLRSSIQVYYEPSRLKSKLFRELFHIALIIFLGVLPALNVY